MPRTWSIPYQLSTITQNLSVAIGVQAVAHRRVSSAPHDGVAGALVASAKAGDKPTVTDALKAAKIALDDLKSAWPSIISPKSVSFWSSRLFIAAAKIEIAGLKAR